MAATFEFEEDNGTQTGSPLKGTTRTAARTEVNWKNIDDSTTAYSLRPDYGLATTVIANISSVTLAAPLIRLAPAYLLTLLQPLVLD